MSRQHEAALAVSLLNARVSVLAASISEYEPDDSDLKAELHSIASELENISNALAGSMKCGRCGRYHDEENMPKPCREWLNSRSLKELREMGIGR